MIATEFALMGSGPAGCASPENPSSQQGSGFLPQPREEQNDGGGGRGGVEHGGHVLYGTW